MHLTLRLIQPVGLLPLIKSQTCHCDASQDLTLQYPRSGLTPFSDKLEQIFWVTLIYLNTGSGCLLVHTQAKRVKTAVILIEQYFSLTQWGYK